MVCKTNDKEFIEIQIFQWLFTLTCGMLSCCKEVEHKYSRSAGQSIRIVYRDIGRVDSPMQEGEHAPHITKQITDIEEIKRLLA